MPDSRKKRGKHPNDEVSFTGAEAAKLLRAGRDLSWLKTGGYADESSLKLVGDRYQLDARQRAAVLRSTCSDHALASRRGRIASVGELAGRQLIIDGFNLLCTVEAILGGGVLLIGRDSCLRDMSSMHGNYRLLSDTGEAVLIIDRFLRGLRPTAIRWLLDKPVSNSGRLRAKILDLTGCDDVQLVDDPDPLLKQSGADDEIVVTADSGILDDCGRWLNTAREILAAHHDDKALVVDFSEPAA